MAIKSLSSSANLTSENGQLKSDSLTDQLRSVLAKIDRDRPYVSGERRRLVAGLKKVSDAFAALPASRKTEALVDLVLGARHIQEGRYQDWSLFETFMLDVLKAVPRGSVPADKASFILGRVLERQEWVDWRDRGNRLAKAVLAITRDPEAMKRGNSMSEIFERERLHKVADGLTGNPMAKAFKRHAWKSWKTSGEDDRHQLEGAIAAVRVATKDGRVTEAERKTAKGILETLVRRTGEKRDKDPVWFMSPEIGDGYYAEALIQDMAEKPARGTPTSKQRAQRAMRFMLWRLKEDEDPVAALRPDRTNILGGRRYDLTRVDGEWGIIVRYKERFDGLTESEVAREHKKYLAGLGFDDVAVVAKEMDYGTFEPKLKF